MILSVNGTPQPPSGAVKRLQEIDQNLDLRFMEHFDGSPGWVVVSRWPENDPRWQSVYSGDINRNDAHDIFAFVPFDCPVDDIPAWAERNFVQASPERLKGMFGRLRASNAQARKDAGDRVIDKALGTNLPQKLGEFFGKGRVRPVSVPAQIG